jgi:hypothetical protein
LPPGTRALGSEVTRAADAVEAARLDQVSLSD